MSVSRFSRLFAPIVVLAAAALVVTLAVQKRSLVKQYMELQQRELLPYEGMWVPTFEAVTLDGELVVIGEAEGGSRQVLLILDTTCSFCRASLPAWEDLSGRLASVGEPVVHVYGISLSPVAETRLYVDEHGLTFPVLRFPDEKIRYLYRANGVPQVIVLDHEGRVIHTRPGELDEGEELDSLFARTPGPEYLPNLLLYPAPRVGLLWTMGHVGALPFELEDRRSDFHGAMADVSGDFRRPLDPAQARAVDLAGFGWRPLGEGGVVGRANLTVQSLDPSSYAHVLAPYGSSPLAATDTSAPAVEGPTARLEGAGGWRFGGWGVGLAAGYEAVVLRGGPRLSRSGRVSSWGASGGLVRRLGGLRLGLYGRWQGWAEQLVISSNGDPGLVHQLKGYAEPEPILVLPTSGAYPRRIEHEAKSAGLGVAGGLAGVAWALFAEATRRTETETSTLRSNNPPEDGWQTSGPIIGGALQATLWGRLLATLDARWMELEGSATRPDLEGAIFRANESALVVTSDFRIAPTSSRWGGALGLSVRRESRDRRDAVAELGTDIEGWVHAATLEVAHWFSQGFIASVGYAGARYSRTASIPDPFYLGPAFRGLIAPELAYYATESVSHQGALTLRWNAHRNSSLWVQGRYGVLKPLENQVDLFYAPDGERQSWSLALGVVLGAPWESNPFLAEDSAGQ
jgi:peroxiredoxin